MTDLSALPNERLPSELVIPPPPPATGTPPAAASAADLLPHSREILDRARPGTTLGAYRLTDLVGVGGHGVVYRATDQRDARHVALKVLRTPADRLAPDALALFAADRQLVCRLRHPNLVPILEADTCGNLFYLAMEFFEGPFGGALNLMEYAQLFPDPLEVPTVRKIFLHLGDAVTALHQHGVLHCDLKPANVLFRFKGTQERDTGTYWRVELKLTDFGLVRLLGEATQLATRRASLEKQQAGQTAGADTLAVLAGFPYLSPQQLLGRPAAVQTDVFALGRLLAYLLTGTPGPDPQPPSARRPDLASAWDAIVARATHRDEHERYPTVAELVQAIAAAGT